MITVQDRIELSSDQLQPVLTLFHEGYQSAAAQRGLQFVEAQVSPPLRLQSGIATLWLRWQVADAGAWWAMRAQSGTPEVAAFWAEVDRRVQTRERVYLLPVDAVAAAPESLDALSIQTRGHRETAQLALKEGLDETAVAELEAVLNQAAEQLPGLETAELSRNLAPDYAAGHYTWDLLFADRTAAEAARATPFWRDQVLPALKRSCRAVHALELDTLGAGLRQPDLSGAIKRTAFFRLLPGVDAQTAQRFEADLLEMPAQIPDILNWRLSRARPLPWNDTDDTPWTYVWEQEFASLEGLMGPYMAHPHHWAHIDRWFDPESGVQAVDVHLSHAFSPLSQSLINREAQR